MPSVNTGIDFRRLARPEDRDQPVGEARWQQIIGLMQVAAQMIESSPDADRIRAFKESQEADWQRIQKRLFAHVPRI